MGYNASKKACIAIRDLEYILAIELLAIYQAQQFLDCEIKRCTVTSKIVSELKKDVPLMEEDISLHPHIEHIKKLIHDGVLVEIAQKVTEELK
jgi:histidine ammonia-lyase